MNGDTRREPLPGPPAGRELAQIPWDGDGPDPLEQLWEAS